jgi:hypothetical protein
MDSIKRVMDILLITKMVASIIDTPSILGLNQSKISTTEVEATLKTCNKARWTISNINLLNRSRPLGTLQESLHTNNINRCTTASHSQINSKLKESINQAPLFHPSLNSNKTASNSTTNRTW